jgi:excisionase family DNA binding protein
MDQDAALTTPAETLGIGRLFTTQEVAEIFRVSQRTVEKWVSAGVLPGKRIGRVFRVRQADLEAFGEVASPRPPAPPPGEAGAC